MNGGGVGDRAFKVSFAAEGVGRLRERVKEKLKEFMGDYTDDTLAEYVVVLLRNGRCKDEAAKELHVFLGDDNDAFVSWLWDHLSSNLHLYARSKTSAAIDVTKSTQSEREFPKAKKPLEESLKVDTVQEKEALQPSVNRQKRAWPGVVQEEAQQFNRQHIADNSLHAKDVSQRKTMREEEAKVNKRNTLSQSRIDAPRRLLVFAVRDAVQQSDFKSEAAEPAPKRLCSVLSTSVPDSRDLLPSISKPVDVVPSSAITCKARTEADEYITRVGSTKSVFDRLSTGRRSLENSNRFPPREDVNNVPTAENSHCISRCHNEGHANAEVQQSAVMVKIKSIDQKSPATLPDNLANRSLDATSLNVPNLNIRQYPGNSNPQTAEGKPPALGKPNVSAINTLDLKLADKAKGTQSVNAHPETQKALPITVSNAPGHIQNDVEMRTIFVSNVHFAATKDSLSRHFNKFGAVLKVIILTDTSTGQPTGSAYVEFLHKESAEQALSLNGTSFMSRILKVIRKSSAEVSQPASSWPRVARGPSVSSRPVRTPLPRSVTGAFRGRLPLRAGGVRSMQWKRDSGENSGASHPSALANQLVSPSGRSFTYSRPEPKTSNAAIS